jgi:WD40 repeat protein
MESQWRCIHTLTVATNNSPTIRFSPDGKTLLLNNRMWDVNTGELKQTKTESKHGILSLDCKTLVACDSDGQTIQIWDVETGELIKSFTPNSSTITFTAIGPDSQMLVTNDAGGNLKLWNVSTGEVTYNLGQFVSVTSAFFSPNGQILAVYLVGKFAFLWDVNTGERIGNLDNQAVKSIAFTSDSKALLIVERTETQRTEVSSPGGIDWYTNTYYYPEIWDGLSGQKIGSFRGQFVGISPDGQIAIGSHISYCAGQTSKHISFTSFNDDGVIDPISGGTKAGFSPSGNILWVEDDSNSYKFLKWPSRAEIFTVTDDYIWSLAFSPDEMTVAIVSGENIKLWQNSTKPLVEQRLHGNAHPHLHKLEDLLAAEKWEDADDETAAIIKGFPDLDVKIVDQLWVHYSKGHYGFSVQDEILERIQQNKSSRGWINSSLLSEGETLELYLGWMTIETNWAYQGVNDEFSATAWKKANKGYYPRKGYEQRQKSRLNG